MFRDGYDTPCGLGKDTSLSKVVEQARRTIEDVHVWNSRIVTSESMAALTGKKKSDINSNKRYRATVDMCSICV